MRKDSASKYDRVESLVVLKQWAIGLSLVFGFAALTTIQMGLGSPKVMSQSAYAAFATTGAMVWIMPIMLFLCILFAAAALVLTWKIRRAS